MSGRPWKPLNWREIGVLAQGADSAARECRLGLDRVIVPKLARFPGGFVKSVFVLRLSGRREEAALWISLRQSSPWFAWESGKGPLAAPGATLSPFAQLLSKRLQGRKLLAVEGVPSERACVFQFDGYSLVLRLIPASPEGILVDAENRVLGTSRDTGETRGGRIWDWASLVAGKGRAPVDPPLRPEVSSDFIREVRRSLDAEAFALRVGVLLGAIRQKTEYLETRARQASEAAVRARAEQDWQAAGDKLKAAMGTVDSVAQVADLGAELDPALGLAENLDRFYRNAKRRKRRLSEAETREREAREALERLAALGVPDAVSEDWDRLERAEKALAPAGAVAGAAIPVTGSRGSGPGKVFRSKDGAAIRMGRNSKENLEVTFKASKGNDLWLHVRGRPSAHAVIHLAPGKSASLDTLLDAAELVLHFSGAKDWGKTEIDYTFRKNVKRIKDSTQVSYTGNKTLIVAHDPERLKRLLDSEAI